MDQGNKELTPEEVDDTIELIEDTITLSEITDKNAPNYAKRLLQYAIKSFEHAQKELPTLAMSKHIGFLKLALEQAEDGNYHNLARFLRSEAEKRKMRTIDEKQVKLGYKLDEMADILATKWYK